MVTPDLVQQWADHLNEVAAVAGLETLDKLLEQRVHIPESHTETVPASESVVAYAANDGDPLTVGALGVINGFIQKANALPIGRVVCGRYEEDPNGPDGHWRLIGFSVYNPP